MLRLRLEWRRGKAIHFQTFGELWVSVLKRYPNAMLLNWGGDPVNVNAVTREMEEMVTEYDKLSLSQKADFLGRADGLLIAESPDEIDGLEAGQVILKDPEIEELQRSMNVIASRLGDSFQKLKTVLTEISGTARIGLFRSASWRIEDVWWSTSSTDFSDDPRGVNVDFVVIVKPEKLPMMPFGWHILRHDLRAIIEGPIARAILQGLPSGPQITAIREIEYSEETLAFSILTVFPVHQREVL